jgi:hypothetical protein
VLLVGSKPILSYQQNIFSSNVQINQNNFLNLQKLIIFFFKVVFIKNENLNLYF